MFRSFFAGGFLLLLAAATSAQPARPSSAQSRGDLEKERAAIQKEMIEVKRSLGETHRHHQESLAQLALLQQQLSLRESAIRHINAQVGLIRGTMNESGQETLTLQRQLDSLRIRYAENLVAVYKNRSSADYLSFIFSATSFNDALAKMQYLRSYQTYRTEQANNLRHEEQLLLEKIYGLKAAQLEKETILKKENKERVQLGEEKKEKNAAVIRLQGKEKELEQRMAARQRQDRKLSAAIAAVMMRAKKGAGSAKIAPAPARVGVIKNSTTTGNLSKTKNIPATGPVDEWGPMKERDHGEYWIMTERFEAERGHFPWPVESRSIAMSFGIHTYPDNLKGNNLGLTIGVTPGSLVKAVFDGEVTAVFPVGDVEAVIIRHGKYFTTYSNLSTPAVRKGDLVKTGQVLGRVAKIGELEFLISDEKDHMFDPEKWLRR
ncbi:MAG TPA: peptidoglycan DD-metalloendopeptidase family protein [Puia sp.]|nr:peptidoglycan DD-metalloendopeptidase family protein [Puia sp.]